MKMKVGKFRFGIFLLLLVCMNAVYGQRPYWEYMQDSVLDFPAAQAAFEAYWAGRTPEKGQGHKAFQRWAYMQGLRTDASGQVPPAGYEAAELARWRVEDVQRRTNLTPTGNWTPMGPIAFPTNLTGQPGGIGRTTTISFHPTDPNTLYVGSGAGGLWVSTNSGSTWSTQTDFLATLGVSAIALDPVTPTTIYIGTGDKDAGDASGLGVYKSTNGGTTFAVSNTGMGNRTVHGLAIDPNNSATIVAVTNNGIYRSVNSGANWVQVLASGTTYEVRYQPGSTSTLYAINATRLYTSTDDGATWNAGTVIATSARSAFAVTPIDPTIVYVVKDVGANPVFKSTDGGATFVNVQTDTKVLLNGNCAGTGTGGQGWYDICIAVDPTNANNVMVGGVSLWKSTDGGVNFTIAGCWSSMGTNVHADHHWLAYHPLVAGRLFDCNDGGVYYTDNFGTSYNNVSSGIAVSQIYRVGLSGSDPNMVVAGFQDNGMIISRQPNWYITVGGDGLDCAIDPTDNMYQYGSYVNGVIRRSPNGGYGWTTIGNNGVGGINETGPWLTPYALQPGNPDVMIAGYVSIWRTTNVKGASPAWTNVQTLAGSSIRDIAFADANTAYASRANGEFYQSLDGGVTWTLKTNPPGGSAKDIATDPVTPQRLWVTSGNDVYRSLDGGTTWALWDTGLPNISALSVVYDKVADALYCGMWTGVYYRHATDPNWVTYNSGLPNTQALHLQIFYDQTGCVGRDKLRLATYGRGLWESDLRAGTTLAPVACFGATPTTACIGTQVVQLTDSSAYDPTSWLWTITGPGSVTFTGGTSATTQNPQVTFSATGLYTVTLDATNANGTSTRTRNSYINVIVPAVNFRSADSLIYVGQSANFVDMSATCAQSWLWDFGDGQTSTLQSPAHVYATAGLYTVSLTINGGINSVTKTNYIQVLPHLPVPYTSTTAGWTGDMETDATAWHYGDKSIWGINNPWERGSVTLTFPAAASGVKCWATDLDANLPVASYATSLYTPTFDFSAGGKYQVRLKQAMQSVFCNAPLGAVLEYTTNQGATWTRLGGKQGTDANAFYNWFNKGGTGGCDNADVVPSLIGWNFTSLTFRQAIYDASTLAGNAKVGFRVSFYSSAGYGAFTSKGFAMDDFEVDYAPSPAIPDTIPGSMIAFDGTNDYVETYLDRDYANFTIEGWVLSPAAPSGAARSSIVQKSNVCEFSWNHPTAANRGAVSLRNSGGTWQAYTFGALAANTWYHLAVTFDGTTVNTYKNGVLVTSAPFTGPLTLNTNTWQLGAGSAYFNGSLDEFRMWNVARTQLEIREAMHRTLDPSELTNVVLYYQSNETAGYLKDVINLRNGYLQNGLGRVLSPIAVGKGVSQSMTVTGTGNYNFTVPKLQMNFTTAGGTPFDITVTRINQFVNQQTPNPVWNAPPNATLVDNNPYFYHVINKFGGGVFAVNATVEGVPGISAAEVATPSYLKLVKRPSNSVTTWEPGIPGVVATISTGFDGTVRFDGITSLSQAFIGSEVTDILDASRVSLMAVPEGNAIHVLWEAEEMGNVASWTLLSASNPDDFATGAARVRSTTAAGALATEFDDRDAAAGQPSYYLLRIVDMDGAVHFSNVASAQLDGAADYLHLYPNPNDGQFALDLATSGGKLALTVTDLGGRVLWQQSTDAAEGLTHLDLKLEGLAKGMYFLTARWAGHTATEKIVIR